MWSKPEVCLKNWLRFGQSYIFYVLWYLMTRSTLTPTFNFFCKKLICCQNAKFHQSRLKKKTFFKL